MSDDTPRFLADAMLERLARWLRVLGVDVVSAGAGESDRALARRAHDERRILLTRDRRLPVEWPVHEHVVLRHAAPLEQLREVVDRFHVDVPRELFTRCLLCNAPLRPASAKEIAAATPPNGWVREPARSCPECGRVYWEGTHTRRMRAALARVIAIPGETDADVERS
jgi:hypothetical protein